MDSVYQASSSRSALLMFIGEAGAGATVDDQNTCRTGVGVIKVILELSCQLHRYLVSLVK